MHTHTYTYILYIYKYTYTRVCVYVCMYMYVCMYIYIYMCLHTWRSYTSTLIRKTLNIDSPIQLFIHSCKGYKHRILPVHPWLSGKRSGSKYKPFNFSQRNGMCLKPMFAKTTLIHMFFKSHMLHGAGIFTKITQSCRYIYHTWSIWVIGLVIGRGW